jgi:hypothetical protein
MSRDRSAIGTNACPADVPRGFRRELPQITGETDPLRPGLGFQSCSDIGIQSD